MDASVQQTLPPSGDYFPGFTPNSPDEKWLESSIVKTWGTLRSSHPSLSWPAATDSSPFPTRVEEPITKNSPAAAAADTELHGWLSQIEAKRAELATATAAAAAAAEELTALEAAAGLSPVPNNDTKPTSLSSIIRSICRDTGANQ